MPSFRRGVALDGLVPYVILREPTLLVALVAAPVLSLLLVALTRAKRRWSWWAAGTSLGWVLAVTLYPTGTGLAHPALGVCVRSLARPELTGQGFEVYANVGLFILFAGCWAWATRRPLVALLMSVVLSAAIELVQSTGIGHTCSGQDWAANSLGALVGALALAGVFTVSRS